MDEGLGVPIYICKCECCQYPIFWKTKAVPTVPESLSEFFFSPRPTPSLSFFLKCSFFLYLSFSPASLYLSPITISTLFPIILSLSPSLSPLSPLHLCVSAPLSSHCLSMFLLSSQCVYSPLVSPPLFLHISLVTPSLSTCISLCLCYVFVRALVYLG